MTPPDGTQDARLRILVVEDEPVLAFALEELLVEAGYEVSGVASRLGTALSMIRGSSFDAAILDANLSNASAAPAAVALTERRIPFIVLSGYAPEQQDAAFANGVRLQKPCPPERLIQAIRAILPA